MKYTVQDGFLYYIELTDDADYKALFTSPETFALLDSINEAQADFRYAPDKWNIRQILGHITDHERIMMYRALRFSRKDDTLLSGYDQDVLVDNSRFTELSWEKLLTDYKNVRAATNSFIDGLSEAQLQLTGKAWIYELTVELFLRATIGHELHHIKIIKERYL
ncbi:MAG: DinB family protein [Niabella sp.]